MLVTQKSLTTQMKCWQFLYVADAWILYMETILTRDLLLIIFSIFSKNGPKLNNNNTTLLFQDQLFLQLMIQ